MREAEGVDDLVGETVPYCDLLPAHERDPVMLTWALGDTVPLRDGLDDGLGLAEVEAVTEGERQEEVVFEGEEVTEGVVQTVELRVSAAEMEGDTESDTEARGVRLPLGEGE